MTRSIRRIAAAFSFILASLFASTALAADPVIEHAKTAGLVGERVDGYLGLVDPDRIDAKLRRHVAEINARRRDVYTRMSGETGESLSFIAALTAARQIEKAAPGEFVMTQDGVWIQK